MGTAELLSLQEVAELEGITRYAVQKRIDNGKLKAVKIESSAIGRSRGYEWGVYLKDLSEKAQRKHYAKQKAALKEIDTDEKQREPELHLEDLTEKQRNQIIYWKKVIKDWRKFIGYEHGNQTKKTEEFIRLHNIQQPDKPIKMRTLYNKWEAYTKQGELGLADRRCQSHRKGQTSIPPEAWAVFFQLWADENEPSVPMCYRYTESFLRREMPELLPLPSIESFKRQLKLIPPAVATYYRKGEKARDDLILPYVQRDYESIDSNDWWTSDYHTLDLMVRDDKTNEVYRPHVVVWMDIRSRKFLGWRVRKSSDSDGVILAFKDAVKAYGIPENVYLDNGREYLTHAFGGRGKRKTDKNAEYATSILELLGVVMHNAIPRNAKGKVVERSFREFTERFAKAFITYCGNRPGNRPERHNKVVSNPDNLPLLSEVNELLDTFIKGLHNAERSEAIGLDGKTPNQVYNENLIRKKTAKKEQLNLMLLRSERLQKVGRNGVKLKIGSNDLWFCNEELKVDYFGQAVFVRYDPDDLSEVRIYDQEERLLCTAPLLEAGGYDLGTDSEAVKTVNHIRKKEKQAILQYKEKHCEIIQAPPAAEALKMLAEDNLAADESGVAAAKVLEPVCWSEKVLPTACGNTGVVDFEVMIENARKSREEK